jgi:hypothetical protein
MSNNMFIRTLILLLVLLSPGVPTNGSNEIVVDDLNARLGKRVTNYSLGVSNFVEALTKISSDFQVPMGVAWVDTPMARAAFPFAWQEASISEIIGAIAKTQPNCHVEIRNGVVNVFSIGSIPEGQNFLALKFKEFEVLDEYVDVALLGLHNRIAARQYSGYSLAASSSEKKISLTLRNPSVVDILNALSVASSRKIWMVVFSSDLKPTAAGYRKTLTLWNGLSPTVENGEPALNLLHWGDRIPWPSSDAK